MRPSCRIDFLAGQGHQNAKRTIFWSHARRRGKNSRVILLTSAASWLSERGTVYMYELTAFFFGRWIEFIIPASRKEKWPQDLSSEPPLISIYLLVLCRASSVGGHRFLLFSAHTHQLVAVIIIWWFFIVSAVRASSFTPNRFLCLADEWVCVLIVWAHTMLQRWMTDVVQRVYWTEWVD